MTDDTPEGKPFTGWPPGLLQDDSRALFDWFASRIDARERVRDVCGEPGDPELGDMGSAGCSEGARDPDVRLHRECTLWEAKSS